MSKSSAARIGASRTPDYTGRKHGPVRRLLLSIMAAALCMGTLATALTALELGATAGPAGASTTNVAKNVLKCYIHSTSPSETATTTFTVQVIAFSTPASVANGGSYAVTFENHTALSVPKSETGYTVTKFGAIAIKFAVPKGAVLNGTPTVATRGYSYPTGSPNTKTFYTTSIAVSTDGNSPSGKAITMSLSKTFPGGVTIVLPTISVPLKATNPTSSTLGFSILTVQPANGTPKSADPGLKFSVTIKGVPLYSTITLNSTCWPDPHPQPPLAVTHIIDSTPPAITIASPGATSKVVKGSKVHAAFGCVDPPAYGDGLKYCDGTATGHSISSGTLITTTVLGHHYVTVTSENNSTVSSTKTANYTVILPPYNLTPPSVTLTSPANNAQYVAGSTVKALYSCSSSTTTIASCTGTVASGSSITTATTGYKTFTATAKDQRGYTATKTVGYYVRATDTPITTTSADKVLTSTETDTGNDSCTLGHNYFSTFLDGLTKSEHTCPSGNHNPEGTWRVTAPGANGGQLVVGDHITVQEQVYKPGSHGGSGTGGYDSGAYKQTLTVTVPAGTKLAGSVSTSKTGLPSATYGGTASATTASACNYTNSASLTEGTSFCNTTTGNIASTTVAAAGSTTVGAYGSSTVHTLYSSTIKATDNGKTVKTIATTAKKITVTSDSGSAKSGRVEVTVTNSGTKSIAVFAYTGHSTSTLTGVTYVSGTKTAKLVTGAVVRVPITVNNMTVLPITAVTGFQTTAGGTLNVTTTTGSAVLKYTSDSTSNTTCGTEPCFTGITVVSGSGKIAAGNAVSQVDHTIGTNVTLHAAADTGFTATGTLSVATAAGTAVVSYTSDSTTAATCGSAACFKGITWQNGAKGVPTVGGAIKQITSKVTTDAGSGTLSVASITGFTSPGLVSVPTTGGTAWLRYTGTSGTSLTGVTDESGTVGTPTVGGAVVQAGPGGNSYGYVTTTTSNNVKVTTLTGSGTLAVTAAGYIVPGGGTVQVVTTTGVVTLTYTKLTGTTLQGVKAPAGAQGTIYSGAYLAQPTQTAIKGAVKVAGTAVSGWTWAVTVTGKSTFGVQWNGSSCQTTAGSPSPGGDDPCGSNADEVYGFDGTYIYLKYTLVVTSTGTITIPGLTSGVSASQHDYNQGTGILTTAKKWGTTSFVTKAITAPGISWTAVDPNPPVATLATPIQGAVYSYGQTVDASYSCSDPTGGVTITSCVGVETTSLTVPNGSALTTTALVTNEIHTFKVTATNSEGYTATSYSSFTVLASPPTLATQTFTVTSGGSVTVPFNFVGTYPATHATEKIVSTPSHGTATIQPTGKITYQNDNTANATDSFQFSVTDTAGNPSNVELVTLNVQNQNKPTITAVTPPANDTGSYARGAVTDATYSCGDTVEVISCTATQTVTGTRTAVTDGQPLDTTSLIVGNTHHLLITAVGFGGSLGNQTTTETVSYTVNTPHPVAANFTVKVVSAGTVTVHALTHVTSTFPITPATLAVVTPPSHGTATVEVSHLIKYAAKTIGSEVTHDSFTYDVKDTDGQLSNKATVGVTIYAVPTITSLSRTGPVSGGNAVTITGTGFSTVSSVKFGTTNAAAFTVISDTKILATAPGHAAGTVRVSVTTPGGTTASTPADVYKFVIPPTAVTAISPASGPAAGGTTVTVSGSGFVGATNVKFGTSTGTTVSVNAGGTQLTVKSPAGTSGTSVAVRVVAPGGESPAVTADLFTYGPTITSISPSSGPVAGGTQVTITGTEFSTVTKVKFGTTTAEAITVRSSTQLVATSPAHAAGTVGISVVVSAGTTAPTSADVYKYTYPVPAVTGISPASGPAAGGTTVTVSGSGFVGATNVKFGTSTGTTVSVNPGGTQLTVKSPAGTSGTSVAVRVVTPGGESPAVPVDLFTYGPTITSISPTSGPTSGGTQVTVTGSGFSTVTKVKFGTTTAESVSVRSATQLVANSPAHAAGTVGISVTTSAGTTPTIGADHFKFVVPVPAVTGISPASGPAAGGTTVTVSGSGFTGATAVYFGSNKGTTVSVNAGGTQLTVKSPAGAAGTSVAVRVVTSGGESAAVPADLFTYGPTITAISPTSGPTTGGTQVTVTGSGFSTVAHVKFGTATAASFTVRSATQIVAISPAHASGTVGISVTTPAGTTPTTSADLYKFTVSGPAVTGISPASGPATGGTTVTVSGSGFTGATAVYFGSNKGTTVSVNAGGTQLTVKSPAGTAGTSVAVQVKTAAGESPAVPADLFTYGPTITSLSRTSGPVGGGTKVTITGRGFSTVTSVKFGTTPAESYTVSSSTSIVATSPAHAAGQVRISVTTAAGTTPATSADLYTY